MYAIHIHIYLDLKLPDCTIKPFYAILFTAINFALAYFIKSFLKGWNKKWVWSPICLTAYYHSVYDKHAKLDAFVSDTIYGHFICTLKTHISCGENNVSKKVVNVFIIFFYHREIIKANWLREERFITSQGI